MSLLAGSALSRHYELPQGRRRERIHAVDGVDLAVPEESSLGLVGESGSGKSTLLRLLLKLEPPSAGSVSFRGQLLDRLPEKALRFFRREVQAVFQDAAASLNPRLVVESLVAEPLLNFGEKLSRPQRREKVAAILEKVGLSAGDAARYPHELSGGQQRRIALARALVARPRLIACDEATSGLDVSLQAQLLNLMLDLREVYRVHYLFISHDLAAVRYLCSRVAVMYAGQIVEELPAASLEGCAHPYTRSLLAAEPDLWGKGNWNAPLLGGDPPDPASFPPGCRFHPRCPVALEHCSREAPPMAQLSVEHRAACRRAV